MTVTPLLIFLLLTAVLVGFFVGWDMAVHHHRASRRALENNLAALEEHVARFQDAMLTDPQRAWIDFGKRSTVNAMEATLRAIRHSLEQS